jgi:hypothetical protein
MPRSIPSVTHPWRVGFSSRVRDIPERKRAHIIAAEPRRLSLLAGVIAVKDLKQCDLARQAHLSESMLSRIISGHLIATEEDRGAIAAVLQLPEDVLFIAPATTALAVTALMNALSPETVQ